MRARPELVVALLTPFDEEGAADLDALGEHVELLLGAGVDALMPCGTTGEGPLLDPEEVEAICGHLCAVAGGRARVIAHVGRADTETTVYLARRAFDLGADAVSAVVPYYYALTDEQILRHFRALLAAAEGRPAYAYTIPARDGNDLSLEVVRALAADGIAGVKDSTKSLERQREYLQTGVDILTGTDGFVVESLLAGAAGCVSALANVHPELLCRARDGEDVQAEISALRDALPFQRLKAAVAERLPGYPTRYRAPLG